MIYLAEASNLMPISSPLSCRGSSSSSATLEEVEGERKREKQLSRDLKEISGELNLLAFLPPATKERNGFLA